MTTDQSDPAPAGAAAVDPGPDPEAAPTTPGAGAGPEAAAGASPPDGAPDDVDSGPDTEAAPPAPATRRGRTARRAQRLANKGMDLAERAVNRTADAAERVVAVEVAVRTFDRYRVANVAVLGGYLAYRLFYLVLPIILLIAAAVGFAADGGVDVNDLAQDDLNLSSTLATALSTGASDARESRWLALVLGIISGVWAALGLLAGLNRVAALIWGLRPRPIVRRVRQAPGFFFAAFVVLLLAVAISTGSGYHPLLGLAGAVFDIGVTTLALVGLYWILPRPRGIGPWQLLPGALTAGTMMFGIQVFTVIYLPGRLSSASATYGALGVALVLLLWLYLYGTILVIGMIINAAFEDRRQGLPRPKIVFGRSQAVVAVVPATGDTTDQVWGLSGAGAPDLRPEESREDRTVRQPGREARPPEAPTQEGSPRSMPGGPTRSG